MNKWRKVGGPAVRPWQEDRAGLPDSPNLPGLVCLQRVHLDIQVGEHANDYAEIAAKDKLSELQLRVRQLVEQVEQIQKEQIYQRVSGWGAVGLLPEAAHCLSREFHIRFIMNPRDFCVCAALPA